MRVEKRDGSQERRILTAMIVDPAVLGRVSAKWQGGLFKSKWSNLIATWCVDYFKRYDKAPNKQIEGLFESWSEGSKDKETVELVGRFLDGLSGEYAKLKKESNSNYVIDLAAKYFNEVRLRKLCDQIQGDLDSGDLDKANKRVEDSGRIEMGAGSLIDVLTDQEAIRRAFEAKKEPVIKYTGALGNFFGDSLERDGLIGIQAPEKRFKTFWLIDMAWRAMIQRKRVAFFEVGDLSEHQIMLRFMTRAAGRPLKASTIKYPKLIDHVPGESFATVDIEEREFKKNMSWGMAWKGCEKVLKKTKSSESFLKLSVHPNSTISVQGVREELRILERNGWVPDVVVIDYADLLAPMSGASDSRDAINITWKGLRAMSQSLHCLVITATQAKASSYKAQTISRLDFAEDKRKYAHVTGMLGISMMDEEKQMGLCRLNWIQLRESEFSESKCVHVAGCVAIANPAIRSIF